jgi:hypothetical protein
MKLQELQGSEYEDIYMQEVENFANAQRGVPGDDVTAALILRDANQLTLLALLHCRAIHVIGPVDENGRFEDLLFEWKQEDLKVIGNNARSM